MTHSLDMRWPDVVEQIGRRAHELKQAVVLANETFEDLVEMRGGVTLAELTTRLNPPGASTSEKEAKVQDAIDAAVVFKDAHTMLTGGVVSVLDRMPVLRRMSK